LEVIKNQNEIENRTQLVDSLIEIDKVNSIEQKNIFNREYKYFIFMDYFEMKDFSGLEKIIKFSNTLKEDFYVNSLETNQRSLHLKICTSKKSHKDFLQVMLELFEYTHQFCYYSESLKWLAFFKINWEFAVFMFKDKKDVEQFISMVDRDELYTIDEVIDEMWGNPGIEIEKNFRKNYSSLSYLE
jgi:hypothetical protein